MPTDTPLAADPGLLAPVWAGTPVLTAVSDGAWLQAMLDAEAALSRAQAGLGTVPATAAQVITEAARADRLDLVALARQSRESANPVVALVREFTALVAARDPESARWVHLGSTSQDILDTATVLVVGRALRLIRADLERVEESLARLARDHRDTLLAGRTLALHAVPTTFGLKAAGWRHLVLDAVAKLDALSADGLPVQLGGAAGTLAGYLTSVPDADPAVYVQELTDAFAAELGLSAPLVPWHVLRTPVVDTATATAFLCGALGKIAVDVLSLTRTEVGEVHEPAPGGRGASSAMPHKRNPVLATAIRSAALQAPQLAATVLGCLTGEDERSAGAWHAEWEPLRTLLRLAGGAAHQTVELVSQLSVDAERMRANTRITGGLIVSERIAAVLAPALGKAAARDLLNEASARSARTGEPLADVLRQDSRASAVLADAQPTCPADLFEPEAYTGAAGPLTDRALSRKLPTTGGEAA
ncbi:3-carboxy-cis,cis-muconate cycloisomerase [Streptomyces davaonensis JCM 4913]|uniref:3-carboxy-cis,cis-muconate cycloisomerase n=1 Tax=Streptomyces davaonensis (strain DSM 101723 / JCM 4913 / KCC S-0913 / 768) TaxID=1214101 RepID=K4RFD6_STRDJ|nr:3-carboxy-cis,cis-muconate cycloisomerase [Streptomyces davaonensis]CCK32337.1 3-carboxy-cis,cis-muconate cycloisomerase [Streptomyces davaonensis JCM 4913]